MLMSFYFTYNERACELEGEGEREGENVKSAQNKNLPFKCSVYSVYVHDIFYRWIH